MKKPKPKPDYYSKTVLDAWLDACELAVQVRCGFWVRHKGFGYRILATDVYLLSQAG